MPNTPNICPTCGQPLPQQPQLIGTADELVAALRIPLSPSDKGEIPREPARNVYEGSTGGFYVTYEGGEVRREALDEALRRGLIRLKYDDCGGCWCLNDLS